MSEKLSKRMHKSIPPLRWGKYEQFRRWADEVAALEQQLAANNAEIARLQECLSVAKQTVDEWSVDSTGRVYVHKDVVLKAINAGLYGAALAETPAAPDKCGICGKGKEASVHVKYGNDLEAIGVKHFYQAPEVK